MKAARLENGVVQIKELPTPTLAYEDALIRMTSAGVCHSDLHIVRGDWAGVPSNMPLGHEGIGIVEALHGLESGLEDYHMRRRAVVELLDPAELGRIKVLAQARGVDAELREFVPRGD